ncbi:filamentous hemagglutinin N-terminal domain-containing protein [Baaleninema sp.]|uniref:two-partner secretion domain-containing protein n=1 Tax=Baaleninema sp. TaxID=3101197 RepID=UPI003CFBC6D0
MNFRFDRWTLFKLSSISPALWLGFGLTHPVAAQIIPDQQLAVPSRVTIEDNRYLIDGGTEAGNNLFHSFDRFSLPTATEAVFNNAATVENILTRVTGGEISNIDGLIRANGTANLFLLNPNGIIFGENARLDIGGSFFASTADSLVFENGGEYSARTPETQPLLSVSVPVGLQFNGNGGEIAVRGGGHGLTAADSLLAPFVRDRDSGGLRVDADRTLALIGGDVNLDGGRLTADSGRIELGAVERGFVSLRGSPLDESQPWHLDYGGVSEFRDLRLVRQAAAEVSGIGVGSMQVVGRRVTLSDGSLIWLQNQGMQPFEALRVRASESLLLTGSTPEGSIVSSLVQETLGRGKAGSIEVTAGQIRIEEGAQILNRTLGIGQAGDLDVRASESIDIIGASIDSPAQLSLIINFSFGTGSTGDVTVSTPFLTLRQGGLVATNSFGTGAAGNVLVNVTDTVEVRGIEPTVLVPSTISASTNSSGNAGNVTINTARAIVRDGGRVGSFTFADGNGGRVRVNATEFVEVSGLAPESVNPSLIDASAIPVDAVTQQVFGLPPVPSGSPGNLEINTPVLRVNDGGLVTVRNDGTGGAGTLRANAETVLLDGGGSITASTRSGRGGNIALTVEDSLQLRGGSRITAEAGGNGNGGNLAIAADTIALLEGSSIDANALEGQGGNIQIVTQGLFLSPDSRITASSQLGVDGVVAVTQPEIDTSSALVQLSEEPIDPTTQVVSACTAAQTNSFVVTGNGGLPPDPTDTLRGQTVWVDMTLTEFQIYGNKTESNSSESPDRFETEVLTEATAWQRREDGTVALVARPSLGRNWRFLSSNCL